MCDFSYNLRTERGLVLGVSNLGLSEGDPSAIGKQEIPEIQE